MSVSPGRAWMQYRCDAQCRSADADNIDAASGKPSAKVKAVEWTQEMIVQGSKPAVEPGNALIEQVRPSRAWVLLHFGKARDDRREMAQVRAAKGKRKK